jgi:D-aminoacyl-tRNA deacylase
LTEIVNDRNLSSEREGYLKVVLQRVSEASVEVSDKIISSTGHGLLLLVGADKGDGEKNADYLADRILGLRIFEDEAGKMNLSIADTRGEIMAVSQFTLSADISKGRRPSFSTAMEPLEARKLFDYLVCKLKDSGLVVRTGEFGAKMIVRLANDGPVTFVMEE